MLFSWERRIVIRQILAIDLTLNVWALDLVIVLCFFPKRRVVFFPTFSAFFYRLSSSYETRFTPDSLGVGIKKERPKPLIVGGDEGNRTPYLLNAIQALSQVSYTPKQSML